MFRDGASVPIFFGLRITWFTRVRSKWSSGSSVTRIKIIHRWEILTYGENSVVSVHYTMKDYDAEAQHHVSFNLDTRWRWAVSFIHQLLYAWGNRPQYQLNKILDRTQNNNPWTTVFVPFLPLWNTGADYCKAYFILTEIMQRNYCAHNEFHTFKKCRF